MSKQKSEQKATRRFISTRISSGGVCRAFSREPKTPARLHLLRAIESGLIAWKEVRCTFRVERGRVSLWIPVGCVQQQKQLNSSRLSWLLAVELLIDGVGGRKIREKNSRKVRENKNIITLAIDRAHL